MILITGAEGYIGSHLKDYLNEKNEVVEAFEGDVRDEEAWKHYSSRMYSTVIHLAALTSVTKSLENPEDFFDTNVSGSAVTFHFASQLASKVLYASSSNAAQWWANPYGATKKMTELVAAPYNNVKGMRFRNVWPGRQDMLIQKLKSKRVDFIHSNHKRDFLHVEDLCNAVDVILDNWDDCPNVVDVCTGELVAIKDVAKRYYYTGEYRDESPSYEVESNEGDPAWLISKGWQPEHRVLWETI